ncbi:integral membrane sensor signal transduction histidine kinase [Solidesulfovibrio carbinoliphilus subsp. oakridgensis]|uniref:histidine kinase n=1 Tax=Solidesulfovibrio carbinoliphilus subsp. oakridgensis TaxID=694327 RepID=G7QAE1_9BACT|nr:PAS domain-containing sensor histidine kinase [Solidesulfovibrio carbinoliphilus]EHJ48694.1 integral membrane sensor signal transduction histidine kinase [Solidesulfovibrio carbinoliphilus subsp. oakridgensis]
MSDPHYYRSLTRTMVAWVAAVALTPLLVCAAVLGYEFHTAYQTKVVAHLEELVLKHKQQIGAFLRESAAELRVLTELAPFADFADDRKLAELLATMQQEHGGVFVDLGLVDPAGALVAYAGPFRLGRADYADSPWFAAARKSDLTISDVFLGLRGLPHFVVAVRRTHDGKDWLVRSTIDFQAFNRLVENIGQGATGQAFILSARGEFQTKPRRGLPVDAASLRARIWNGPDGGPGMPEDRTMVFTLTPESGRPIVYVATLFKDGQWALVYQQDEADAFPALYRARLLGLAIVVVGGVGILAAAWLLARRMAGRIAAADAERDLLNDQVIEAGKLASVGELAAGIAHEINNPVAIMMEEAGWVADILADDDHSTPDNLTEMRRALDQIRLQGTRCKEITHKLLSFARKTDSRLKELDLNELVAEMAELSDKRARYVNVRIKTDLAPGLPHVAGSPSELQQLVLNLVNNAMDAMERNGGDLTLATRLAGDRVELVVSDTGHGMPKAVSARIFEPFFTTKAVGKGTGLGLSICYGIVKKIGGEITVESAPEQGATFRVFLPAAAPAPAGAPAGPVRS